MQDDLMKKAIKSRMGKGIDITITLSPPEDDKKSELAPAGDKVIDSESGEGDTPPMKPDGSPQDQNPDQDPMNPNQPAQDDDQDKALLEQLMSGMSDYNKGQISDQPKGLHELAMSQKMKKFAPKG